MHAGTVRRAGGRALRYIPLLLLTLSLSACGGGSTTAEQVAKVVSALGASAAFADRRNKAGKAFKHFVERRATYLISKNPGWGTESGFPSLSARIGAEIDAIGAFIDSTLTALEHDNKSPPYRDLDDAAKRLTVDGPSTVSTRAAKFKADRKQRVAQIAWRAGAVQDGVWSGADSALSATLQDTLLLELLDRRLRAVEIMMLHDGGQLGNWTVDSVGSDWKDMQRTSLFEYPWVDETSDFKSALGAAGLTIAGLAPTWNDVPVDNRIYFAAALTRFRQPAAGDWTVSDKPYVLTYTGAGPVSAALERIIPPSPNTDAAFEDFWQRCWMYCDMMLALLHVEAFRFARKRRTSSDADFDGVAAGGVTLRPLIPRTTPPQANWIMTTGGDWFDGALVLHEELQIGDHLILWNSAFVRNILWSAFGLENSIVTRVAPNGKAMMLAGHGEPEFAESHFLDELSSEMKDAFDLVRKEIDRRTAADPSTKFFLFESLKIPFEVVTWAPYDEQFISSLDATLSSDGAWWIRIRRQQLQDQGEQEPDMTLALARVPKSVRVDPSSQKPPSLASGHDADYQESIYLPLSVPKGVRGGWPKYFENPKNGEQVELVDLKVDGKMVPGFYSDGPATKIPVFRPKVHP